MRSPPNSAHSSEQRVLILSGVKGDTRRYRSTHLYEQFRIAGVDAVLSHLMDPDLLIKARSASAVFIHRAFYNKHLAGLIEMLRKQETLLVHDVDDLVFDPQAFEWIDSPDFTDPIRASLYQEDLRRYRKTLEQCAAVTASTEFLAQRACMLGKPTWVHRNAFSMEMLALSEQAYEQKKPLGSTVIIGYASGTPTHNKDFALVKPALIEILNRFPNTALHLIGPLNSGADWGKLAERVNSIPLVPWRKLPSLLSTFDINLAPLVTSNPFCQSKSEIKYMEAALVRVPTIASPTEAFSFAIEQGKNGFLATRTEDWLQSLAHLVENEAGRLAMGQSAYAHVVRDYHPVSRAKQIITISNEISSELSGKKLFDIPFVESDSHKRAYSIDWVSEKVEEHPNNVEMAWYNLKNRGVRTLLGRIWVFFRRLLAPIFPFQSL